MLYTDKRLPEDNEAEDEDFIQNSPLFSHF